MKSGSTRRAPRALALIPLAALVAILPLIIHGCSCGHDFDFHLLSWIEAANQFSHGNLHPHWAFTPAFNAGEPRFVFYPPISWYLGAVLGLILTHLPGVGEVAGWTAAPIVFTWIALTASGVAMYRLAREFATSNAALLAAALYIANPYMLFTAYERTAYAELLAAAWMPLLVLAILRVRVTIAGIAVPLALLWLTNAPAAVMGSYTLAALAALRLVYILRVGSTVETWEGRRREALQFVVTAVAGTVLGLGLAAFYVVPAAYERRYVQISMAIVQGLRIQDNFLFRHTTGPDAGAHDTVLHTASLVAVLLLGVTAVIAVANFIRRKAAASVKATTSVVKFPLVPLNLLTVAIGFLLTPWSLPIWNHAPEAAFLQFPWRLLAVLSAVLALLAAGALDRFRLQPVLTAAAALALSAALTFPAYRAFGQHCFREDTPATRLALFHSNRGTDPTDEYTPVHANNDVLKTGNPAYWLADSPLAPAPQGSMAGVAPLHLTIAASHPEWAILNLRNFSLWMPMRGRELAYAQAFGIQSRSDGLIAVRVDPGLNVVDMKYQWTRDQMLGDIITVLSLVLLIALLFIFSLRTGRGRSVQTASAQPEARS